MDEAEHLLARHQRARAQFNQFSQLQDTVKQLDASLRRAAHAVDVKTPQREQALLVAATADAQQRVHWLTWAAVALAVALLVVRFAGLPATLLIVSILFGTAYIYTQTRDSRRQS
jgi:anti-sigma factor RsiW